MRAERKNCILEEMRQIIFTLATHTGDVVINTTELIRTTQKFNINKTHSDNML